MASTFTPNKDLEKPGNGDYVDTWNVPVNSDLDVIDQAFGGVTSLNATSGSATLTSTQYRSLTLNISGAIAAPVTYTIPSAVGGQWVVRNTTTDSSGGPHAVIIRNGGGDAGIAIPRGIPTIIYSDGTNVRSTSTPVPGSDTEVIFNDDGSFGASSDFTWDGSVLTATDVADDIGNVRDVPVNSQTGTYILVATDAGKFISITTGGVTVPSSLFTVGQTVKIYNNSVSSQTITQGTSVTLRQVGTTNTGNRTLAAYGLCTLLCVASNTFVITGGGVS